MPTRSRKSINPLNENSLRLESALLFFGKTYLEDLINDGFTRNKIHREFVSLITPYAVSEAQLNKEYECLANRMAMVIVR